MKKVLLFIIPILVLATSCEYEYSTPMPNAHFTVDYNLVVPGEAIYFKNNSSNADYYEWTFGDGAVSNQKYPIHSYSHEGIYDVTLAAYYGNRVDYTSLSIEVFHTTLDIEVRDYETDELIPRINAVLYASYDDYFHFLNKVGQGQTDYDGRVIFQGLEDISYYIDLYNNSFNNYTLAYEDILFIKTDPLAYAMHNTFVAYVDYDPVSFKSADANGKISVREVKIKSTKRSFKDKQASKE